MSIVGHWTTALKTPFGVQSGTADFTVEGGQLTGTLESEHGLVPVAGTVDGDTVHWVGEATKPLPMTLTFDVTVEGDSFAGTVKVGRMGKASFTGVRA